MLPMSPRPLLIPAILWFATACLFSQQAPRDLPDGNQSSQVLTGVKRETVPCYQSVTAERSCKVHWKALLSEIAVFNAFEDVGNIYTGYWYRYETTHGKWLHRYFDSVSGYRFWRWSDDNPMLDDYVGHPMMGAITNYIWLNNDPQSPGSEFENSAQYWRSRERAFVFSTIYSTLWKVGPFGEAAIGHNGDHIYWSAGKRTNGTGFVSLVTTPVGGLGWTVAEDVLDKNVIRRLETKGHNPVWLMSISFLNPSRSTANMLRLKAPWYRENRMVRATSQWSGEEIGFDPDRVGPKEFGFWSGWSFLSGQLIGTNPDVKFGTWDIHLSRRFVNRDRWALRFAPTFTPLAVISEPHPDPTRDQTMQRHRVYGGGFSPAGLQLNLRPRSKYQPFLSATSGVMYFGDHVLSPQGSRFVSTSDLGGGIQMFHSSNEVFSFGYKYQHLHNLPGSGRSAGTDANTFFIGISKLR